MIATTSTKITYQGNGLTTEFAIPFAYLETGQITVILTDPQDKETTLETDFFVDTDKNAVIYPGYPPGQEPALSEQPEILPSGWKLTIHRSTEATQFEDIGDKYPLPVIEKMVDKVTQVVQELKEEVSRAVKVNISTETTPDELIESIFEAETSASTSALAASGSATEAAASAKAAEDSESAAALSEASAAEILADIESAAATVGVIATVFDITKRYEPPALVMVDNGDVYRCIHPSQGEHPALSSNWVIAAIGQKETFERDENGDMMPCEYAQTSGYWQNDDAGDIYPAPLYTA